MNARNLVKLSIVTIAFGAFVTCSVPRSPALDAAQLTDLEAADVYGGVCLPPCSELKVVSSNDFCYAEFFEDCAFNGTNCGNAVCRGRCDHLQGAYKTSGSGTLKCVKVAMQVQCPKYRPYNNAACHQVPGENDCDCINDTYDPDLDPPQLDCGTVTVYVLCP